MCISSLVHAERVVGLVWPVHTQMIVSQVGSNRTSCGLEAPWKQAALVCTVRALSGYLGRECRCIRSFTLLLVPPRQESARRKSNWQWVDGGEGGTEPLKEAISSFTEQIVMFDFVCSIYWWFWLALLHVNSLDFLLHSRFTRQL